MTDPAEDENFDNIDLFNFATLAILGHLYTKFPIPANIDASEIVFANAPDLTSQERQMWLHFASGDTVRWLDREGFITFDGENTTTFFQVCLTAKGLAALGKTLSSLEPSKSLGKQALELSKQGVTSIGKEVVSQVVSAILKASMG